MKLFHKHYPCVASPQAETVIILHGLFGNQGNWAWQARRLSEHFQVFAFDARNHGRSDWYDTMTYQQMAGDVIETMDALDLERAHFIAHSMGGKTAMQLAMIAAERLQKLLVVDIVPIAYPSGPFAVLDGLQAVDLTQLKSRSEADGVLSQFIEIKEVRDFLLSNLQRNGVEGYTWRFNLKAVVENYPGIKGGLDPQGVYDGEVLFIKGADSDYIQRKHKDGILTLFPHSKVKIVENAGHWVHSEKPEAFLKVAENYLLADC